MNKKREYIEAVNKLIENQDFYFLDEIFIEYLTLEIDRAVDLINKSFETQLILNKEVVNSHMFRNYWKVLATYFEYLSIEKQKIIIELIKNLKNWNRDTKNSCIRICKKYSKEMNEFERIKFLDVTLHLFLTESFSINDFDDNDLNCLWVINQINNMQRVYTEQIKVKEFNFNDATYSKLRAVLSDTRNEYRYYDFKSLLNLTGFNLLYFLFFNQKIKFKHSNIFPSEFYQQEIIQRILINVDLERNILEEELELLKQTIDIENKFLGEEMNQFSKKHQFGHFEDNFYSDAFEVSQVQKFNQKPFVKVERFSNLDEINLFVKLLEKNLFETYDDERKYFDEFGVTGQIKEILTVLNKEEVWADPTKTNFSFLEKIIKSNKLSQEYKEVVAEMFEFSINNNYMTKEFIVDFLNYTFFNNIEQIDFWDSKILNGIIDFNDPTVNHLLCKLLVTKMKPGFLESKSSFVKNEKSSEKFVDLNDFYNSSLGRYYLIIRKIPKNILEQYSKEIKQGIFELEIKYQYYIKGQFYYLLDLYDEKFSIEHLNTFIGFSHSYNLFVDSDIAEFLIEAARELFNVTISDSVIVRNLSIVLVVHIDPDTTYFSKPIEEPNVRNQVFMNILDWYFLEGNLYTTELVKWIRWFIRVNESVNIFVQKILYNISSKQIEKINILLNNAENSIDSDIALLDPYIFSYVSNVEKFSAEEFDLLIKLIEIVLEKKIIKITSMFVENMKDFIGQMKKNDYDLGVEKLVKICKNYFLESDIKKLTRLN